MTSTFSDPLADAYHLSDEEVFVFPASFAQQRLWFLNQISPESSFYNVAAGVRLHGQLNLEALEQTFNQIVHRHESLRTTFMVTEAELAQVISPRLSIALPVIDLAGKEVTPQLILEQAQRPFNLTTDPLLRVVVFKLGATEHILLLTLHHIISDGWSMGVLIRELGILYRAFAAGQPSPLPDLPIQYADFAQWQREWLQDEVLEAQLGYWQQQLQNLPLLDLPTDFPRPSVQTYRGATQSIAFSQQLTDQLEALSQQEGTSLFMTLLAAFQTLLFRYTGQEDVVVGSPIANRNRSELENLIGFFVNSLVLRINVSSKLTFRELLGRVREVALGAYDHQDLPFEKLVQALHPPRDLSRHPLFQVAIALQNTPIETLQLPNLSLSQFNFDMGTARLDLEFHLWQSSEGLRGQITYSTDLFEQTTIERLTKHFETLLEGIVDCPDQQLIELPLLPQAEQQLLLEWNKPRTWQPETRTDFSIHHLFEAQVQKTPNAIAVVYGDEQLSYQELNHRSNCLAHHLQTLGVQSETLVGLCVDRSLEMIVGILGILKAGGAYVPLDPTYPLERLQFMLEDTQVAILVTQQRWSNFFADRQLQPVYLDQDWQTIAQQNQHNPTISVTSTNLAYVIYTSGSTGKPKGVMIEHGGLCNMAQAQRQTFNPQPNDRILQFASLSFDASIFEIVMALQVGATLYLTPKDSRINDSLLDFLRDYAITIVTLPPTVLKLLPADNLPALKTIISAGEACTQNIIAHWVGANRRFYNAYGLTETTIWASVAEIENSAAQHSIGRAIANTQLYVLNSHLQPVPIGVPGELYIGGDCIARGYLHRPELTVERFISNPFWADGDDRTEAGYEAKLTRLKTQSLSPRLYKTGDLVRYRSNGELEFLGRIDDQVKIRGYRIELGEIETVLSQHSAVREAAVIVQVDSGENQRMVACVVPNAVPPSSRELRDFLQQKLPDYLVPSTFAILESLPLTPNGKIDRTTLRSYSFTSFDRTDSVPRTPTEAALAQLWRQVLSLETIGIDDHFFEQGGDSLLAMQLMQQIHQQFQRQLPLSTLFLAPTIAQLAPLLETSSSTSDNDVTTPLPWSPLVLLSTGAEPAVFCVHPVFGVVFPYVELARQLQNYSFYGLQPLGLGSAQPHTRIEDMAAQYIQAVQSVQPQGPYFLAGWSFGGLVAFEMAQQLQRAGHEVAMVILLDTLAPTLSNKPSLFDSLKFLLTTAVRSAFPFLLDYLSLRITPSSPQKHNILTRWYCSVITDLMPEEFRLRLLDELTILPMLRVFYANSKAAYHYAPKFYSDKITLLRTAESTGKAAQDLTMGWSQLAKEVEVHSMPGNHLTMLRQPHVQQVAAKIQACIEQEQCKQ